MRGTLNLTEAQAEGLKQKQEEINVSKVKESKNLNFKKCKIAEHMVATRHPLSGIHLAKALPVLGYLP